MILFKRVSIGRDSLGVNHAHYEAVGLPDGIRCQVVPEQADRPKGEWFVAGKRGGRKTIIRCKSKEQAIEKAEKWCRISVASVTAKPMEHDKPAAGDYLRPTKRKARA